MPLLSLPSAVEDREAVEDRSAPLMDARDTKEDKEEEEEEEDEDNEREERDGREIEVMDEIRVKEEEERSRLPERISLSRAYFP